MQEEKRKLSLIEGKKAERAPGVPNEAMEVMFQRVAGEELRLTFVNMISTFLQGWDDEMKNTHTLGASVYEVNHVVIQALMSCAENLTSGQVASIFSMSKLRAKSDSTMGMFDGL